MKIQALFAGAALMLAACGGGQEQAAVGVQPPISEVVVNTDLSSIGNAEAVQYWQTLETDLEAALVTEFVNQIDPSGLIVTVDVSNIALADFLAAAPGSDQARLAGQVTVSDPIGSERGVFNVAASSAQAATLLPAGTDITTVSRTQPEYYQAVVQAFARGVAEVVRTIDTTS